MAAMSYLKLEMKVRPDVKEHQDLGQYLKPEDCIIWVGKTMDTFKHKDESFKMEAWLN